MPSRIPPFLGRLGLLTIVSVCVAVIVPNAFSQTPKIEITEPVVKEAQDAVKIAFKITGARQKLVRVKVDCVVDAVTSKEINFAAEGEHVISVNLFKGANTITLIGFDQEKPFSAATPISVNCSGRWCKEPFGLSPDTVASEYREGAGPAPAPTTTPTPQQQGGGKGGDQSKQKSSISIETPKLADAKSEIHYTDSAIIPFEITVKPKDDPTKNIKSIYVRVLNEDLPVSQKSDELKVEYPKDDPKKAATVRANIKIAKGVNEVTIFERGKLESEHDSVRLICDNCGGGTDAGASEKNKSRITIDEPEIKTGEAYKVENISSIDSWIAITKSDIKNIEYEVRNGSRVWPFGPKSVDASQGDVKVPLTLKFARGQNFIRIFDSAHPAGEDSTSIIIECTGDNCASDLNVATIATNSMNTRAIVGMEQAGASSASSETKPFLDFFFTNGIFFNTLKRVKLGRDGQPILGVNGKPQLEDVTGPDNKPIRVPRFGTWGQVRFSTTPQQTASASVFPSNFVNQVTDPTKVVDLVQSFDFLAGIEVRAASANGWNWTLIPGVKQKSRFFITFGAGAISPLNAARTSAQIFKIPGTNSPQRTDFVDRFGEPPAGKTYVGFVPLERDRFFRQYYLGIRFKSHYCDDDDCIRFRNSFPSIVDFGIGQNEAVTGGELEHNGKRSWVLRLDTFYPLPFKEVNFLYLYGTAMMKIGQGGVRIDTPLFLDTAPGDVQITSPDVFIPPADLQPSRLNRDYYKIGIGVNLTDLFNRNKPRP